MDLIVDTFKSQSDKQWFERATFMALMRLRGMECNAPSGYAEAFYGRWVGGSLHGVLRRTSDAIPVDPLTKQILWDVWPWATASLARVQCP